MNRKNLYTLVGATIALTSLIGIANTLSSKKKGYVLSLTLGIVGLAAGTVLACQPERKARKQLTVGELLDACDVERMEQNIAEILGEDCE